MEQPTGIRELYFQSSILFTGSSFDSMILYFCTPVLLDS